MKKTVFYILVILTVNLCNSQELNNPESVVYSYKTESYYVSSYRNGTIQKREQDGTYSLFVKGLKYPLGLTIKDDLIYVADSNKILAYNIITSKQVFNLKIPKAKQLNDLVFDDNDKLYVSDRGKSDIYVVSIKKRTATIFNDKIPTPNGLFYDKTNQTLLVCNTIKSSSIFKIDTETGVIINSKNTELSNLDGIVMDNNRNIFVTSWSEDWLTSKLFRFNTNLSLPPKEMLVNKHGMADIFYNEMDNIIVIANWYANSIYFLILK